MKPNMCRTGTRKGKIELKKRLLSILLAAVMALSAVPLGLVDTAWAASSGTCGVNVTWRLSDDGTLTVSGTGKMEGYTWSRSEVKRVVINDGITEIGDSAFAGYLWLQSVSFPDSITKIGDWAFSNCQALTQADLPKNLTTIGKGAFEVSALHSILIPDSVTSIGDYAFQSATWLDSIFIPASVTHIGERAFQDCGTISVDPDNPAYSSQYGALFNKEKTVLLKGSGAYYDPSNISEEASFRIPRSVTRIDYFAFCGGLSQNVTSVMIPRSVTDIGSGVFDGCRYLSDIYYEGTESEWNAIKFSTKYDGEDAWRKNATIHYDSNFSCYDIIGSGTCGDMLRWTLSGNGVLDITGTGDMTNFGYDPNQWGYVYAPWDVYSSKVNVVTIGNGVTSVGANAFEHCRNIIDVLIPVTVTSIGESAFLTALGRGSYGDSGTFYLGRNVSSIGAAALNEWRGDIIVPQDNKWFCEDGGALFTIDKKTLLKAPTMNEERCVIPEGVETLMTGVFKQRYDLSDVVLPESLRVIEDNAFDNCPRLESIRIPAGVTTIGTKAFFATNVFFDVDVDNKNYTSQDGVLFNKNMTMLYYGSGVAKSEYTIPSGVTIINDSAFSGNEKLEKLTIADSVTTIGWGAFDGCKSLTDVYYIGTASDWAKITIGDSNEPLTRATLHYVSAKPVAPTVKTGNSATSGKPQLTWRAVYGATSYRIYRSTAKGSGYSLLGTTTATSYTNTGAKAGTTYYYRVKAVNDAGLSPYSNIVSGQAKSVTPKLSAPVVKIGNSASSGKPMLTWNAVSGATSYKVYRATSQNGTYSLLGTVTATSYTNTGAKAGTTYWYKVKAVNSAGESAYSNVVSGQVKSTGQTTVTTLMLGHSSTSGKPQLTWKAVSGAASYKVYRATSKNGVYSVINTTKALTYTNTGAALGITYYYKVEALNAAGKSMGFSAVVEGKVAPVLAVGYSSVSGKPQLTWKAVPGATEYQVYRSTQQNSGYTKINTTTSTSYVNTGAKANTTYYYKIVAVKGTVASDFSNIVSARPSK